MKNLFRVFPLALLAAASLHLKAEEPTANWSFNAGVLVATGDTKAKITPDKKSFGGYEVGLGFSFPLEAGLGVRIHGNLFSIDGSKGRGVKKNNLNFLAGVDLVKTVGSWSYFGGMTVTEWNPETTELVGTTYTAKPSGGKLGLRVGAEYAFLPNLSARLAFTQTEYNVYLNPSWVTAGIVYKF